METLPAVLREADHGEDPAAAHRSDLESWLIGAIDIAEALAEHKPSRSLAMVRTKLDEAEMWLARLDPDGTEGM